MAGSQSQRIIPRASKQQIALVGILFSLTWSSAFIAGKIGLSASGPLTLLALRFLLAGALLWLILRGRAPSAAIGKPRDYLRALIAGWLTNVGYLGLAYTAMREIPVGLTAILVSINPMLTSLLAYALFREKLGWRGALGLVMGFLGVYWIMQGRAFSQPVSLTNVGLVLCGTLALAIATLLSRQLVGRIDPWRIAMLQLPTSGLLLLPLAIWLEGLRFAANGAFFGSLFYQASIVSIGTTLMLLWLIRHGGVSRASGFHLLNPAFGSLLAVICLGEEIPGSDLLGALPIVAGLGLILSAPRLGQGRSRDA